MALSRGMSAFVALTIAGGWNSIPAAAQGIEPVAKPAAAKSKAADKKSAAKASKPEGKTDPEASNRALEAGIKSYTSGKYDPAIASLNTALQGGGLPSHRVARALYYRGMAHRKQGKSAQAIADLKGALWLGNGLSDSERAEATAQHAAAYKDAGLGEAPPVAHSTVESTEPARSAAATASAPAPAAIPAAKTSGGWQATTASSGAPSHALAPGDASTSAPAPPATTSSGSGIGGLFSSIFGGGSTASVSAPAPAAQRPVTTASTGPAAQVSSWVDSTSVEPSKSAKPVKSAGSTAQEAKKETANATGSSASGNYRLEVGTTTSRDEAEKVAKRLRAEHAGEIASRELAIDEGKFGASRYFRVGIGPFANADEPGKLCAALKAKGMDCLVVTR